MTDRRDPPVPAPSSGADSSAAGSPAAGSGWSDLGPPRRPPSPGAAGARVNSGFSQLAVTHCLAVAGDTLVTLALAGSIFFSISPQAARGRVALFLVLTMAPFAVVAPLLGPALDRSRGGRRAMLILASASRAAVCVSMSNHLQGLLLFPEAFVVLVLSKAHAITKSALVPSLVASHRGLVEANSRLAVLAVIVGFVTAVPGAIVLKISFLGAEWVMLLAGACFAAAAVAGLRLPRPTRSRAPLAPEGVAEAELHGASVRLSASAMAVLRAIVGFLTFLVAFSLRRADAAPWLFGVVLGASMLGTFIGNVVAPLLRRRIHEERILIGALGLVAVVGFLVGRFSGPAAFAVLALAVGTSAAAGKLAFDSIVQRDAPDALRGRTFARFETRFQLVWVLGAFLPVIVPIPGTVGTDLLTLGAAVACVSYVVSLGASSRYRSAHRGDKASGAA